jgi:hypothetical protein
MRPPLLREAGAAPLTGEPAPRRGRHGAGPEPGPYATWSRRLEPSTTLSGGQRPRRLIPKVWALKPKETMHTVTLALRLAQWSAGGWAAKARPLRRTPTVTPQWRGVPDALPAPGTPRPGSRMTCASPGRRPAGLEANCRDRGVGGVDRSSSFACRHQHPVPAVPPQTGNHLAKISSASPCRIGRFGVTIGGDDR